MALDRTWFNALIDDDGTGMTGSVWDKADIANLLNSVDSELARIDAAANKPICIVANSIIQPWGSGVWANVPFGNDIYDPYNLHTPGDYFIYLPKSGVYLVNAVVGWPANANGNRGIVAQANGSFNFPFQCLEKSSAAFVGRLTALVQIVNTSSYLTLQLYQDSGVSLDIGAGLIRFEVYPIAYGTL